MAWMGVPAALNNRLWARLRARNAVSSFMVFSKSARCSSLKGCTYLMIITSSGRGEYATKSGLTLMRYCISIVSKNFWSGTYCANKKENAGRVANYLRTMGTIWRALSRPEIMMMGQIAYLDAYGVISRHIILTVPAMFRTTFYQNAAVVLSALMRCGVQCLDDFYSAVRGKALRGGYITVIHTHGRNGQYHPHLHLTAISGGMMARE